MKDGAANRWDSSYLSKRASGVSWFEASPATSLELIRWADFDESARGDGGRRHQARQSD